jgi:hypothetical protein
MAAAMTAGRRRKIIKKRIFRTLQVVLVLGTIVAAASIWFFSMGLNSEATLTYKQELQVIAKEQTTLLISDIDKATEEIVHEVLTPTRSGTAMDRTQEAMNSEAQTGADAQSLTSEQKARAEALLKEEYKNILYRQKDASISMLNGLISKAKVDYAEMAESGKTKVSLAAEYIAKVNAMEKQTDSAVETLVTEMYGRMEELGIENRDAIVAEFRSEYRRTKEENRNYFWSKAMEAM